VSVCVCVCVCVFVSKFVLLLKAPSSLKPNNAELIFVYLSSALWQKSHTHALCYIKALFQKWFLCSSFSAREIKNRNIHALWMYFPSRKCAVVGAWHWLHTITWHPLPRLPLAGTCGARWRKAFLTGPRSPEELLETGRRTMSVEPGEQWGGLRDGITMAVSVEVLGHDLPATAKGRNPQRWSHGSRGAGNEWGTSEGDALQQRYPESTCHDHISSADT